MSIADRILAPSNSTPQDKEIGVLTLAAAVSSTEQDCFAGLAAPATGGRFYVSLCCSAEWFVCFGPTGLAAANPAVTGWLGAGVGDDGRCYGPIPAGVEFHREIGQSTRFLRAYSTAGGVLRAYLSSPDATGVLPA